MKRIEILDDNLNDYFGPGQSQDSQETADTTPFDTPEKSCEARSKNDPDGSNCQRVDKAAELPLELEQPAQNPRVSSLQKTHKLVQDSPEGRSSNPSSESKQTAWLKMKPKPDDSSLLSSSSNHSER